MGCFARTCGISNTGINEGESVVIIVFNQPSPKESELYQILQYTYSQQRKIAEEKKKTYDDKLGFQFIDDGFHNKPINRVIQGEYNDYGWIEDDDTEPDYEYASMRHLVFHTWAVEHILNKKIKDIELTIQTGIDILQSCFYLRKSPLDWMLGNQHPDVHELKAQLALNEASNKYLSKKIKEYEKEYGED
jgi:hypothetical protein